MIKVQVDLSNDSGSVQRDIEITTEEIKQFACNKAKGMFIEGYYTKIQANEVTILSKL